MDREAQNSADAAAALSAAIDSIAMTDQVSTHSPPSLPPAAATAAVKPLPPQSSEPSVQAPVAPSKEAIEAEEKKRKKRSAGLGPRWSYILTRGFVVGSVWAFFAYAFDPLVRLGVIVSGQTAAGAKVDIATLETSFFPPTVTLTKSAVANRKVPFTNLVEFDHLYGDIDGFALLKGSYVVDKATITGLTWASKRADDGLLPGHVPEPPDPNAVDYVAEMEKLGKDWAKNIIDRAKLEYDPRSLETVRLADQLDDEWKNEFDRLEKLVKGFEGKVKLIKTSVDGAKKGDTFKKIDSYTKIAEDSARLLQEIDRMRRDIELLPNKAKEDLGELNAARKRDTAEIRRKVNDLVLDGDKLSEFLLGPTLHHRVKQTLSWLQWANGRVDEFANPPKPERFRGEDILFTRKFPLPNYLVRLVDVQGGGMIDGESFKMRGTISDITSEPKILNKPTVVRMEGLGGEDEIRLKATLDRTQDVAVNDIDVSYEVNKPLKFEIGDKDSFFIKVGSQGAKWSAYIRTEDNALRGRLVLVQDAARFEPQLKDNADERLVRLITNSMKDIDKIEATVQLEGTVQKPQVKLKTNLGPVIARGVQDAIGSELATQQEALVAKLDAKANEKTGVFINQFNARRGDILNQLDINESTLRNLVPKTSNLGVEPAKFEDLKKIFKR